MTTDDNKQHEWDALVASEKDCGKQILRPFEQSQWELLGEEIIQKLELQDKSLSLCSMLDVVMPICASLFEDRVSSVTGIDYSPAMISEAKKKLPQGHFEVSSADKLPFSDDLFDRSLSYSVFHYFLSDQQIFEAINELCRVTKRVE